MGIVEWWRKIGVIETGSGQIDLVLEIGVLEGELGAAARAERPNAFHAGIESRRLPFDDPEIRRAHAEPSHEWRAGRSAANRAMAIRLVERRAVRFVADRTAKTSTGEQDPSFVGSMR